MSDIDVVALEQGLEEKFRMEYASALTQIKEDRIKLDRQMEQWKSIVEVIKQTLMDQGEYAEGEDGLVDADAVMDALIHELQEHFKLKKLLETINSNALLKSQWDKLVMSIRLTGGDQND